MDRRTPHDLGGSREAMRGNGREQHHHPDDVDHQSNFLPSTRNSRGGGTEDAADSSARPSRYPSAVEDLACDDSFDDGALVSQDSLPTANSSWDEQSDDEQARRIARRDRRKFTDATTPTLIDEDDYDEEEEMVSLEQARLRRADRVFFPKDESSLRRTPGAQMYKSSLDQQSMRRTPGASQMHDSARSPGVEQASASADASGLGFGLTLSTPVAASDRSKSVTDAHIAWKGHSTASNSPTLSEGKRDVADNVRPPRASSASREHRGVFAAPWISGQLDTGRGSDSPNTLRLRENLDLLLEDDDAGDDGYRVASQPVFRDEKGSQDGNQEGTESWTAPYVISMDAPSRVPRSGSGRTRKVRSDSGRRGRGYDRFTGGNEGDGQEQTDRTGGFPPYAQHPKPLRKMHPASFVPMGNKFFFGDNSRTSGGPNAVEEEEERASPRLLNFGGAFVPPSKGYSGTFRRPVPAAPAGPNPGAFAPPYDPSGQGTFPATNVAFVPDFHNSFQPPLQTFGHKTQPMFGNNPAVTHTPTLNFPPPNVGPFSMQAVNLHQPPQDFMQNIPLHPHQRTLAPPFAPQVWPQAMPVHYDGTPMDQSNWHPQMGGWSVGEFSYGMAHGDVRVAMTPTPTWPEVEQATADMSPNPFSMLQQSCIQSSVPPTGRMVQNQARARNQRRGAARKGSKSQPKNDKGQKKLETSNQALSGKKASSTGSKTKKKQKDRTTAVQNNVSSNASVNDETAVTTADDPADAKRAELMETPATRSAFKDFYRRFRAEERASFQDAESFAMQALSDGSLPETVHWRVYLELADLAKRANRFVDARKLYSQVCSLQPYASQGWLEYSKLEEECGNMNTCAKILFAGLEYCQYSENLLTRAIKHEEKMGKIYRARELLARLKHVGIEKVWRTVLEGALLEARAGNYVMARRVLKYLMHHVPWYGPLYLETYRLEKDLGRHMEALSIVQRGLAAIPRYGPLWFGAFRLCEAMDRANGDYLLSQSMEMIDRATFSISKELIWKVHLEAAQMLQRAAVEYLDERDDSKLKTLLDFCRKRFAMTILTCPPNLRWKVWLASGRMEVAAGDADTARSLFLRAHQVVPEKGRAVALLECARLEEFVGDTELASAILCKSRIISGSDWKVWLESVLLEMRGGNHLRAIEIAEHALEIHTGTGRLWASLVQLRHFDGGEEVQFRALKCALNAVPKSGEVWCEGARIHLNPFSRTFDVDRARRHLLFATKFTPQYGDGFLETLRLEVLDQWLLPIAKIVWQETRKKFSENEDQLEEYVYEVARSIFTSSRIDHENESSGRSFMDSGIVTLVRQRLCPDVRDNLVDIAKLQLKCANADPNYGSLWFHCRIGPTDTARKVLSRALHMMLVEMTEYAHVYVAAFVRRFAVLSRLSREIELDKERGDCVQDSAQGEGLVDNALLAAPCMKQAIEVGNTNNDQSAGMSLLESGMTGSDFVTGLVQLSKHRPVGKMSLLERKKVLFGSDALFS